MIDVYFPFSVFTNFPDEKSSFKLDYKINGGSWKTLGESGDVIEMDYHQAPSFYSKRLYFDPEQSEDYDIKFRYRHKISNGAIVINQFQNATKNFRSNLILEEII